MVKYGPLTLRDGSGKLGFGRFVTEQDRLRQIIRQTVLDQRAANRTVHLSDQAADTLGIPEAAPSARMRMRGVLVVGFYVLAAAGLMIALIAGLSHMLSAGG